MSQPSFSERKCYRTAAATSRTAAATHHTRLTNTIIRAARESQLLRTLSHHRTALARLTTDTGSQLSRIYKAPRTAHLEHREFTLDSTPHHSLGSLTATPRTRPSCIMPAHSTRARRRTVTTPSLSRPIISRPSRARSWAAALIGTRTTRARVLHAPHHFGGTEYLTPASTGTTVASLPCFLNESITANVLATT